MKSCIVIGLSRFGAETAGRLFERGCEVLAMDMCGEAVQRCAETVSRAVIGDARDADVLRALGVWEYECAVVATGADLETAAVVTMNLRQLGAGCVICLARDGNQCRILQQLGADRVVLPEQEAAARLADQLTAPRSCRMEYLEDLSEIPVPQAWVGHTLRELDVRAKFGVTVVCVQRDGSRITSPGADDPFRQGDLLLAAGPEAAREALNP